MRIGFDAKRLFTNKSGLGVYSRTLVRNLLAHGPSTLQLYLYTPRLDPSIDVADLLAHPRVSVRQPTGGVSFLWRTRGMVNDLVADQVELYHGLSHELPLGIERTAIRTVVTIHDLIYKVHPEWFPWFDRQVYDWKFSSAIRRANRVVAISEHTKQDVLRYHPHRAEDDVSVVYQSCHSAFFASAEPARMAQLRSNYDLPDRFVLYVGSLNERKNALLILEAYALQLAETWPPLVVVGRGGDYKQRFLQRAQALGLTGRLHVLDSLDDMTTLADVYRAASVFVYPSRYEGFGIPLAEAALTTTPIVAGDMGALREAGGTHASYVDPDDAAGLAEAIARTLAGGADLAAQVDAAKAYAAASFDAAHVTAQLLKVYASV